jgi:MFS family permease
MLRTLLGRLPYSPLVAGLIATDAFMSLTRAASYPFLAIYLAHEFELDAARIGLLLGAGPIFGMIVGLFGGAWSDRIGRWPLLLAAVASSATGIPWSFADGRRLADLHSQSADLRRPRGAGAHRTRLDQRSC